jgi:uncharacterized protein YjbI with pentapeptide repeats
MDAKKLEEIVLKHEMWLQNEEGGARAVLADADLTRAVLWGANLQKANFQGANLQEANFQGANLEKVRLEAADLRGASLWGATLRGAGLEGARLQEATFQNANLERVNLARADLRGVDFEGARLQGATLYGAELFDANFENANLAGVDFRGANLEGTNLRDADLTAIKYDLWEILSVAQDEIEGLVQALKEGKVDGSAYTGECACLIGTIANIRGVAYDQMPHIRQNKYRPAERWFLGIRKGDTPETNQISAITLEWIEEFLESEIGKSE